MLFVVSVGLDFGVLQEWRLYCSKPSPDFRWRVEAYRFPFGREPRKLPLQPVDLCEVSACVMVAAPLTAPEPEAAAGVLVAGSASAQVDDCGEVLPLLQRGGG